MAEVHKAGPARVGLELSNWLLKFWSFWDKDQTNQLLLASSSVAFNAVGLAHTYRDPPPPFNHVDGLPGRWETGRTPQEGFIRMSALRINNAVVQAPCCASGRPKP